MSTIHLKPNGEFCGGTLLQRKPKEQSRTMVAVFVNGQEVKQIIPIYARCIVCGTEVLMNPVRPDVQIDVPYEIIRETIPNDTPLLSN